MLPYDSTHQSATDAKLTSYFQQAFHPAMENFRSWVARNVAAVMFLTFYFLTVVLANLIYASPLAESMLDASMMPREFLSFQTSFTVGYWILLLMPFVAVPALVPPMRWALGKWLVGPIEHHTPDFGFSGYSIVFAIVMATVAYALWRTDAFALVGNATSAKEAIDARFVLQSRMSFPEKVAIHSLLPFLSLYALTAVIKVGGRFWLGMSILGLIATFVTLVAINMKWPVLIFYIGAVAAIFMYSKRLPYLKAILGSIGLVILYLTISTYVFRWVPVDQMAPLPSEGQQVGQPEVDQTAPLSSERQHVGLPEIEAPAEVDQKSELNYSALAEQSAKNSPMLFVHALNRMAIAFPYYYQVFTEEGAVCGTLIETYTPGDKPCAPTYLIYSRIFPDDEYSGRGSAPAAPHITAYAQQSWAGSAIGMVGICILLAAFAAISLGGGVMAGTWAVVGAMTGYHLSQIPGEGVIIYDHGILWPLMLVAVYSTCRFALRYISLGKRA